MFGLLLQKDHYYICMKKFILTIFILYICAGIPVFADETGDLWDSYNSDITNGQEAKAVSDEEFEDALKRMDSKVNKWKNRFQKKQIPKGEEFSQSNETEIINNNQGEKATLPVICLPIELATGEDILPVGHYQVKGEKDDDGKINLKLYQASQLMAEIPANETNEDFDQEEILFANWILLDENRIKIIYGSLDFNAYAVVNISQ